MVPTIEVRFDASGWAIDPVRPLPHEAAYTLFTSDASARFDERLLAPKAASLLGARLAVSPEKRFERGASPPSDLCQLELSGPELERSLVWVRLFPPERAPDLVAAARAAGRAGMERLIPKARRVLQVAREPIAGDARAPLACATVLCLAFLTAILPPDELTLFGTKGARERLAKVGLAP